MYDLQLNCSFTQKNPKKLLRVILTVRNCLLCHTFQPFSSADMVPAKQKVDLHIKLYRQRQKINSKKLKGKCEVANLPLFSTIE